MFETISDASSRLVEEVSNRLIPVVFKPHKEFFEAGIKGASSFSNVESDAFGAMNNADDVLRQTVELFDDAHVGL